MMTAMTVRRTKAREEKLTLGSLRLYREDLTAIATALAEGGELLIKSESLEATSAEDLDQFPEHPAPLTLSATRTSPDRRIAVRLAGDNATVELTEPDTLSAGIVSRIRLICEPRRRRMRPNPPTAVFGFVLIAGALFFAIVIASIILQISPAGNPTSDRWLEHPLVTALFVLGAIAASSFLYLSMRPKVLIVNALRADRPTYWQRTSDLWWVGIITSLAGALVGYVLGKIT